MKILPTQTDEVSLAALGAEARLLLLQRNFVALADKFSYALAFGRAIDAAIEADFRRAVQQIKPETAAADQDISVQYFSPNSIGLFAVVECIIQVSSGVLVLLELIVTKNGNNLHVTLEDISRA